MILSALCCLVYFTSYITRINYAAAISEIAESLHLSNQLVGMAVIGSFITYGAGQPICGFLGDRIQPRNMIFAGLLATVVCNLVMSLMSDIYMMTAVWCLNGFFQAMLWPPLVRIMSQSLSHEQYRKVNVGVVASASAGTVAVYLLVPFCIWISGWRLSFIIPAIFALAVAFVWFFGIKGFAVNGASDAADAADSSQPAPKEKTGALIMASGLLPIMLVIVLQGALRDGITTWMPTYINDMYHFGTSISILSTAILPIFTIVCVAAASQIYRSLKNELTVSAFIWVIGLVTAVLLVMVYASSAILSILLMAILTGCMHGINLMLISQVPLHFAQYGRASTISGILNAFTYVGSALSIYGIAALSEHFGWDYTILCWGGIALAGTVICFVSIKRWGRFSKSRECARAA